MKMPYLKYLRYKLNTSDELDFNSPDPLHFEAEDYTLKLEEGILNIEPKIRFENTESAITHFHELIRSWEIDFALKIGSEIEFKFQDAKVVKENTSTTKIIKDYISIKEDISITKSLTKYPKPNPDFKASNKVQNMYYRYRQYLDGKEPLLSMAYYCLTELEKLAGGRPNISSKLNISAGVIRNYGRIISSGGKVAARKAKHREITNDEVQWIKKLIPKLIKQLGKYEAGKLQDEDKITNADLPTI